MYLFCCTEHPDVAVVYERGECPLCTALHDIEERESTLVKVEEELDQVRADLDEYKETHP